MKIHFLFILFLTSFWSCKENILEIPDKKETSPVFRSSFQIGSETYKWEAGVSDLFMHTKISKKGKESNFTGLLSNVNCEADCSPSLEIIFHQYDTDQYDISEILPLGTYNINQKNTSSQPVFQCAFSPKTNIDNVKEKFWNYEDGTIAFNTSDNIHYFHSTNDIAPTYRITDTQNNVFDFTRSISFVGNEVFHEAELTWKVNGDSIELKYDFKDEEPFIYFWTDINNPTWNGLTNTVKIKTGKTKISCNAIYSDGTYITIGETVGSSLKDKSIYYNSSIKKIKSDNAPRLGTITVNYRNEQGVLFSSNLAIQNENDSNFELTDRKNYDLDKDGNTTQIIKFNGTLKLQSKEGSTLEFSTIEDCIFAIGID